MGSFLAKMAVESQARCDRAEAIVPSADMRRIALSRGRPRLPPPGEFVMIAEVKLASPSEGRLRELVSSDAGAEALGTGSVDQLRALDNEVVKQAGLYAANGASYISVLSEPTRFCGDLRHVARAAAAVEVPVMRKDFLVSPYQVYEARAVGASAVLLIVRLLDDATLKLMMQAARECGMNVILEIFDQPDLVRAQQMFRWFVGSLSFQIGVNTRDLVTLAVEPDRLERLMRLKVHDVPWIAESGLATSQDVRAAVEMGYSGVLVGSALMKSADPALLCGQMAEAGRVALRKLGVGDNSGTTGPRSTPREADA